MILEAFDFAVTSCLPRGTQARRRPPPEPCRLRKCQMDVPRHSQPVPPKRLSCLRWTRKRLRKTQHAPWTWISHRLSTTSLCTPGDINLELAQRTTVTPRVPVCDVSAWLPRDTRPHLSVPATGGQPWVGRTLAPGQPTSALFPR